MSNPSNNESWKPSEPSRGENSDYGQYSYPPAPPANGQPYGDQQYGNQPYGAPQYGQNEVTQYGQYGQATGDAVGRNIPTNTVIPFRPLNVAETIDSATRILRFNPLALILVPAAIYMISGIVTSILTGFFGNVTMSSTGINASLNDGVALITLVVSFLVSTFVALISSRATIASVKGRKISLADAGKMGTHRIFRAMGSYLVLAIIAVIGAVIGLFIVGSLFVSAFASMIEVNSLTLALFMTSLMAFLITVSLGTILMPIIVAMPVVAVENKGPFGALKRSFKLISGNFGYLIAVFLACVAIVFVIAITLTTAAGFFASVIMSSQAQTAGFVITGIISLMIYAVLIPFITATMNIAYVNLRFRAEGWNHRIVNEA